MNFNEKQNETSMKEMQTSS